MVVVTADGSTELQSNRGINLAGTVPHDSISGSIDTLIVAGGPGAEIVPPVGCPVKRFCVVMSFIPSWTGSSVRVAVAPIGPAEGQRRIGPLFHRTFRLLRSASSSGQTLIATRDNRVRSAERPSNPFRLFQARIIVSVQHRLLLLKPKRDISKSNLGVRAQRRSGNVRVLEHHIWARVQHSP
jgi:hypothetical protein